MTLGCRLMQREAWEQLPTPSEVVSAGDWQPPTPKSPPRSPLRSQHSRQSSWAGVASSMHSSYCHQSIENGTTPVTVCSVLVAVLSGALAGHAAQEAL